jgi:hypothetical protein
MRKQVTRAVAFVVGAALAAPAVAQKQAGEMTLDPDEAAEHFRARGYSPYADRGFPTWPLWGDTHLHTANSPDAFAFGNRLGPEEAYRFARGETVTSATGQRVQLSRPLDFLVVADHGVAMGAVMELYKGNPTLLRDERLKRWHLMMNESPEQGVKAAGELISAGSQGDIPPVLLDPKIARSVWTAYTATAERFNDPGRFTALIGYEWTSLIKGNNLHRVLIFRGDKSKADQIQPFTFADSTDPEKLWEFMAAYEKRTGDFVLAIPHNGNLSNGMMFMPRTLAGRPFDRAYAQARARWEPVYEITQIKGDGEAHPFLAQRRVRGLRAVGQGQPRPEPAQDRRHAAVRVCPRSAQDRSPSRRRARHEPVQVRRHRQHRLPYIAGHRGRGELLRQAHRQGAERAPLEQAGPGDARR